MKVPLKSLWLVLLLVPVLWWAWPSDKTTAPGDGQPLQPGRNSQTARDGSRPVAGDGPARARSSRRLQNGAGILKPAEFDQVDRILRDDTISIEMAVMQLRALAMDRTRSTAERLEALQHGLNLGIGSFAGFAEQEALPPELASEYLNEIINHNESPVGQIRAYIALVGHPDEEVSSLASEMLALQVGDDMRQADREKLIELGRQKLGDLAKLPDQ